MHQTEKASTNRVVFSDDDKGFVIEFDCFWYRFVRTLTGKTITLVLIMNFYCIF